MRLSPRLPNHLMTSSLFKSCCQHARIDVPYYLYVTLKVTDYVYAVWVVREHGEHDSRANRSNMLMWKGRTSRSISARPTEPGAPGQSHAPHYERRRPHRAPELMPC